MKVTWNWLNEFVDLEGLDIKDIEDRLASQGIHVEEVTRPGEAITEVYAGLILSVEKHPDADRLQICTVDMGAETLTIVTAAPNVRSGVYVPVAVHGATLHGGMKIKRAKLRGVASDGMFCSLQELGLAEKSDGIHIMEGEPEKGSPVHPYAGLDDTVIDFEITANRPDCLSVYGIAREVAVASGRELRPLNRRVFAGDDAAPGVSVSVKDADRCLRYTARRLVGVNVSESPIRIRTRLELVGLRSINNAVDITNYVMWEYGLPLHAFDAGKTGAAIEVRRAADGEPFKTLYGDDLKLDGEDLLIADGKKGIALAGVIGGENSGVSADTKEIILEAALFEPSGVRATAKRHGQRTDSSYRFERGLDFALTEIASARAAGLFMELAGASLSGGIADIKNPLFEPEREVSLRWKRMKEIIGIEIPRKEARQYFEKLSYGVTDTPDGLSLRVPSSRYWDICREIDLIEEVARFYGYDKIPETLPLMRMRKGSVAGEELLEDEAMRIAEGNGFFEVYTFPMMSADLLNITGHKAESCYRVTNPLNIEMEYMTPEPLVGLLKVAETNIKRGVRDVRIYERTRSFAVSEGERDVISFLCAGEAVKRFHRKDETLGFFDMKGLVDELGKMFPEDKREWASVRKEIWEEGTGTVLLVEGCPVAEFGAVKGAVAGAFDLKQEVWAGYFYTHDAAEHYDDRRRFKPFSQYPPMLYDLAFVVDECVKAGEMRDFIAEKSGALLQRIWIFDLYQGKSLEQGKKSIAFSLEFRSGERTLNEKEIGAIIERLVKEVSGQYGAVLR